MVGVGRVGARASGRSHGYDADGECFKYGG